MNGHASCGFQVSDVHSLLVCDSVGVCFNTEIRYALIKL